MALPRRPHLIDLLPRVRGRLTADAPLGPTTWFRVGGAAEVLFRPKDVEDLAAFLAAKPADVPVTVIGVASNLLVRDGGVSGVVIRLGGAFAEIGVGDGLVYAGAGALDTNIALTCAEAGLGGLEFLSGIPGTIGGALRMNAGAYGSDVADVLVGVTALSGKGEPLSLAPEALGLQYRHSTAPEDWIFLHATLRGENASPDLVASRITAIQEKRYATQPIRSRTGGSTFANPPGAKAWALIDQAGCRGLRRGAAMVSELHANFLVNLGGASAADIEGLGEEVRRRVFETSGIDLQWEIRRIGRPLPGLKEATP